MKTNPLGCKEVAIDADLKGHLLRYIHYEYTQLPNQAGTLSMDGSNLRHTDLCSHSNSTYLNAKNEFIDRCTRSVSGKPLAFLSIAAATQGKESSSRLPTNLREDSSRLITTYNSVDSVSVSVDQSFDDRWSRLVLLPLLQP